MKRIVISVVIVLSLMTMGCDKDFEQINTDPNKVALINPSSLLSPILYNTVSNGLERAFNFTHELMQVSVPIVSRAFGVHRYEFSLTVGSSMWSSYYSNLTNINDLIAVSQEAGTKNYQAVGFIIRAWNTSILTDAFGDVPYFAAAQADEGVLQPEFDSQESIYHAILKDLEDANNMLKEGDNLQFGGDILYSGNALKWKKLCNSLRLRLLLRTMNNTPNALTSIKEIITDQVTYPVFNNIQDEAVLKFTNVSPFNNPYLSARFRDFSEDWGFSTYYIAHMEALQDPRFYTWSTKSKIDTSITGYDGVVSGYKAEQIHQAGRYSSYVKELQSSSLNGLIMTYAEVEFIKAELAFKGHISGDAALFYNKAVEAAIERWGVDVPDNYLDNPSAAFNGSLERIIFQKYLNYFFTDYQAWFEKRRTGYPEFPLTEFVDNNGVMPSRLTYPPQVSFYNEVNYNKAILNLGGTDDINKKVWWEQ